MKHTQHVEWVVSSEGLVSTAIIKVKGPGSAAFSVTTITARVDGSWNIFMQACSSGAVSINGQAVLAVNRLELTGKECLAAAQRYSLEHLRQLCGMVDL